MGAVQSVVGFAWSGSHCPYAVSDAAMKSTGDNASGLKTSPRPPAAASFAISVRKRVNCGASNMQEIELTGHAG